MQTSHSCKEKGELKGNEQSMGNGKDYLGTAGLSGTAELRSTKVTFPICMPVIG